MKFLLFSMPLLIFQTVNAQLIVDTTLVWQGYAHAGITHLQIYQNPTNLDKPRTLVIKEIAENQGPSIVTDLPYLAEDVGRTFGFDPVEAFWILHWGAFSFENAKKSNKELFLRATFKRTSSQQLSSPQWRVIDREGVEELTDRAFY